MPPVRLAFSPDSDDIFMFWALLSGRVDSEGLVFDIPVKQSPHQIDQLAALADPAIKQRIGELGAIPIIGDARQFAAMLTVETDRWRKVVEMSGQKKE